MSAPRLGREFASITHDDLATTRPSTPEQLADAASYVRRHGFDDEQDILDELGLS